MFNIKRFSEQFAILLRQNKNRHLMILAIFVGIQLFGFVNFYTSNSLQQFKSFQTTAAIFTFILVVMACQDVFNKLRNTPSGIQYLMLPATIAEKYAAAWLYSSVFILIVVQATYFIVQFLGVGLGNLITGMGADYGWPTAASMLKLVQSVFYTHALFFFGSILFRKAPIIKTLGAYIGIVFLTTLIFAWYANHYLFGTQWTQNNSMTLSSDSMFEATVNGMPLKQFIEFIGLNIKWILGVISVMLWGGAYLLLNKKQI